MRVRRSTRLSAFETGVESRIRLIGWNLALIQTKRIMKDIQKNLTFFPVIRGAPIPSIANTQCVCVTSVVFAGLVEIGTETPAYSDVHCD